MGITKRLWEEAMERGYSVPDANYVCASCVSNILLKEALKAEALDDVACDYCESMGAAPIEVLLNEISDAAFAGFTDAANELPYESREGGYQGQIWESWEILEMIDGWTENERLVEDVAVAFSDVPWCKVNHLSLDAEQTLRYGWNDFTAQIKHRTRYLFLQERGDGQHDEIPPGMMLAEVEKLLATLVEVMERGSTLFRVRVIDEGERLSLPSELGPPTPDKAMVDNRMSPTGIPLFYAAEDVETAVAETLDPVRTDGRSLAIGQWRVVRDLTLLDLTNLPEIPDPFDHDNAWKSHRVKFIHAFVRDLTKPIDRAAASVEYVPTQAVAEHVRVRMRTEDGRRVDGIRYRSSQREGGVAVVIFARQENCGVSEDEGLRWPERDQQLELTAVHHKSPASFQDVWTEAPAPSFPLAF